MYPPENLFNLISPCFTEHIPKMVILRIQGVLQKRYPDIWFVNSAHTGIDPIDEMVSIAGKRDDTGDGTSGGI